MSRFAIPVVTYAKVGQIVGYYEGTDDGISPNDIHVVDRKTGLQACDPDGKPYLFVEINTAAHYGLVVKHREKGFLETDDAGDFVLERVVGDWRILVPPPEFYSDPDCRAWLDAQALRYAREQAPNG